MTFDSIKIETDRANKVREHIKETRQTISGFIALAIDEKLGREKCDNNEVISGSMRIEGENLLILNKRNLL